ncbi:hypothetical protein M011DRAFT_408727 [Sporormia fimetaria CBS 119925]|uniref:Lytic polysaccharide monooxygenase n=1 Tax=Sporormia fimetaria CBS 119925 TaxID=1340428 RepID=A0A6A6V3N0_9PLEO|nr:hypothetical protein M011DRAFT_408727 [Sporormia fimetaria CBS 119925]
MPHLNTLTTFLFLALSSPIVAQATVTQASLSGLGQIWVLESDDWRTGNPSQRVGCLTNKGRFVNTENEKECGVFEKLTDYPYTIESTEGNCTFNDEKSERNRDSYYGKMDHAWTCHLGVVADVYDGLYTVDGFNYPFLCVGDLTCYFDAPHIPKPGKSAPLWQFRWGSLQRGITPGHVMVQLMWHRVGEPKRDAAVAPGPRIEVSGVVQAALKGQEIKG